MAFTFSLTTGDGNGSLAQMLADITWYMGENQQSLPVYHMINTVIPLNVLEIPSGDIIFTGKPERKRFNLQ